MVEFNLMQYIPDELMIMIAGLYLLGYFLKTNKYVKDNLIPIILLSISIVSTCLFIGSLSIQNIFIGIIAWGVSIGINQLYVQNKKSRLNTEYKINDKDDEH